MEVALIIDWIENEKNSVYVDDNMKLVEIIEAILRESKRPLTPLEIRDIIKVRFHEHYSTEYVPNNIEKGKTANPDGLLLGAVYSVAKQFDQFTLEKSAKPMLICLTPPEFRKQESEPVGIDKELGSVLSHRKTRAKIELSTRLGRILENVSYSKLLRWIIFTLVGCAIYFFIATSFGHGIKVPEKDFSANVRWDALYFSIVTFTSLGYGDLSPQGIGKAIASFEVLVGIILMAVFIGKVASERQSTSLLLLSTSDNQRRLRELEQNVELSKKDISLALSEQDQNRAAISAKRGVSLVAGIRKYLTFQANQAQLTKFGNTSSLRDLYSKLREYQQMALESYKLSVARGSARVSFEKIVGEIHAIAEIMVEFHPEDLDCKNTFLNIGLSTKQFFIQKTNIESGEVKETYLSEVSEFLLIRVHNLLKSTSFDKNTIKIISNKLNISRRMTQRCVNELVAGGVYIVPIGELAMRKKKLFEKLEEKKDRVKRRSGFIARKEFRQNRVH